MWQNWTNAILGIAIIIIAFLGLSGATLLWSLLILGAIIMIVGFWGGASTTEATR